MDCFHSFQLGCKQVLSSEAAQAAARVSIPFSQAANPESSPHLLSKGNVSIPFSQAANLLPLLLFDHPDFPFPFLLVRLQTPPSSSTITNRSPVSIPFSQAANSVLLVDNALPLIGFHSFQLGYKHLLEKSTNAIAISFHSFQLGCKQDLACPQEEGMRQFPFLLVRLQTGHTSRNGNYRPQVSIPFSQAANLAPMASIGAMVDQFPFLLVRLQTQGGTGGKDTKKSGFHSFQLGCKPAIPQGINSLKPCVSIPFSQAANTVSTSTPSRVTTVSIPFSQAANQGWAGYYSAGHGSVSIPFSQAANPGKVKVIKGSR